MHEDWLGRWAEGRTGWHEAGGNDGLKKYWPDAAAPLRVLVPLCGKSPDLLWLAARGHDVVGVELSEIAVRGFFDDHDLAYEQATEGKLGRYAASDCAVTLYHGDYFDFDAGPFDALYDRGALVALPEDLRPRYVEHTKERLKTQSLRLIVTVEYDKTVVPGPPFSVLSDELAGYWGDLERVGERDDVDGCPPKFRQAGLKQITEVFWLAKPAG